ncbi:hypothetical protein [Paenibacillus mesotrionivorans]|uniref:Uncharacterized protein n=1 Tax=Paenibacillus mesotrionivorans TaxID=3160968 RepID=A0ACC7NXG9_9BACL
MVTVMYFILSFTLAALIALVDMLLRKQSIQLELLSVFSKNENMNIIYYLFFWMFGLLWGGVTDYRFWKAKRSKQS